MARRRLLSSIMGQYTRVCAIGLLLCLAVVSAGCPGGSPKDDKLVLRYCFGTNFKDLALWTAVIERFEQANPDIRVQPEFIAGDYHQKIPLMFISGTAADVVMMDDEIFPSYSVRGYLEDLRPYLERDRDELDLDDFLPTTLEAFNYHGLQGGMPWDAVSVVMFYNKDLFDRMGVPYPDDDWTWNDYADIARRLTKDLDGDGRSDQFGSNLTFMWMPLEPLVWSFGGDFLNEERTAFVLDRPEGLAALRFVYDLKYKDHAVAWNGEMEGVGEEVQLLTGRLGMVMGGCYMMMLLDSVKDGMGWDVAPAPRGPTGLRYTRTTSDGVSINARTTPEKKEAAWRFIKFMLNEESQALVATSGRGMPVRRSHVLKYWCRDNTPVREEVALEAMDYGRLTPITPKFMSLKHAFAHGLDPLIFNLTTPEEAVRELKPAVNEVLRKEIERWGLDRSGKN